MSSLFCPNCGEPSAFSKKRSAYYCAECEQVFDAPQAAEKIFRPQTVFLSYAHKSECKEDYDISEELVLLIQQELQRDGHTVWIDKDGIRGGSQWRERITSAILQHEHFLSFLSVRSVRDPGVCLNEIAIALGSHKNIQTVLAEDETKVAPPLTISHVQWHDFQDWEKIRDGKKVGSMGETWNVWFSQRMEGIRVSIESAQQVQTSGELKKLRDILDPRSFEARIIEKTEHFFGREWLFNLTQDWLDNSNSRMFWLKGSPGIGKSTFSAMLAHQAKSAVIGFFMCDFQGRKDPEESAREAICTLAFQIASRLPDYRSKLLYEKKIDKEKINNRTADDLFEFLITEPLNRSGKIPESTRLFLIVDALDEAGRNDGRNALAELLAKHSERLPEWLGLLVTSRPEPYLEQMFIGLSGTEVDGQNPHNKEDLINWIENRLPQSLEGKERKKVVNTILEKSGGTFLYLNLIVKDKEIDLSNPENLPNQLSGYFKQTFNRYFPNKEEYSNKTEPFLRIAAVAPGPLPEDLVREILNWNKRELANNVIEPMGSLLQERGNGLVFFHASLGDWLKNSRLSGEYVINDDGYNNLGQFLIQEFEIYNTSKWQFHVINWLGELLPYTTQWSDTNFLIRFATLLEKNRRFIPSRRIRRRVLELEQKDLKKKSDALEALADNYTESAVGDFGRLHFDHAIDLLKQAWVARREAIGSNAPETLMTLAKIPYGEASLYIEGKNALASILKNENLLSAEELIKVKSRYAYYLYEDGDLRESKEIYHQLLNSCNNENLERATALSLLGFIEYESGDFYQSIYYSQSAIDILKSLTNQDDTINLSATCKINLAMSKSALGLHNEATRYADESLVEFGEILPEYSAWWGAIFVNVGLIKNAANDLEAAKNYADKASLIAVSELGENHFESTLAWTLQASFILMQKEALPILEKVVRVRKNTLPKNHWRIITSELNLAYALRKLGLIEKSDEILLRLSNDLPDDFTERQSIETVVTTTCRMISVLCRSNDYQQAHHRIMRVINRCKKEQRNELVDRLTAIANKINEE